MSEAEKLRSRATRLFALALKARDEGKADSADELTSMASEAFDQAVEIERRSGAMSAPPAPEEPQHPAQQQQQPQPKGGG